MIRVDLNKCIGCSFCVDECPCQILKIRDNHVEIDDDSLCIACGHCAAICPSDAIGSDTQGSSLRFEPQTLDPGLPEVERLLRGKRSVRSFKAEKIAKEQISKIIEVGEFAPTAHNHRMRKYYIVENTDEIARLSNIVVDEYRKLLKILNPVTLAAISIFNREAGAELRQMKNSFRRLIKEFDYGNDTVFRNPSHVICVAAPNHSQFSRDDCIASQHYMMLFAKSRNIDSFIVGFAQWAHKKIEKSLGVPGGLSIYAISVFGFGKHNYNKAVNYSDQ